MLRMINRPVLRDLLLWLLLAGYAAVTGFWLYRNPDAMKPDPDLVDPGWMLWLAIPLLMVLVYLLLTGIFAYFYRPCPGVEDDCALPICTVIVPAYNEGAHVETTLKSLLACNYPAEKLEIIAINDGSLDDTWNWIERGVKLSPERIRAINLAQNGGKKHALYIGMKESRGEIIITVDSDSIIEKDALRNLVAPFADARTGAVAGNIKAKQPEGGFIAAMLDVTLVFGCEFLRAAQSATGTVFCTPGALSAYRKSAVEPLLDEWLHQTFMGQPARIGEDRAIATLILRNGYRIVHQSNALALTCVPDTYKGLCKMLLRWTRSDIRENLLMTKFAFQHFPSHEVRNWVMIGYWFALMENVLLPFMFVPAFFFMLFVGALHPVLFVAGNVLFSLLWAAIPGLIYARNTSARKAVWALVYGIFCPFALSWICIYSFLTMRDSRWMTREIAHKTKPRLRPASALSRR